MDDEDSVSVLPAVSAVVSSLAQKRALAYHGSSIQLVSAVENKYPLGEIIMARSTGSRVEGYGTAEFKDGRHVYEGEFHKGVMHGQGKYSWKDGVVYEGQFTDCHITGEGTYTWLDGSCYHGNVVNGLRHGQGTFCCRPSCRDSSSHAGSSYTGEWLRGKRHGKGRLVYEGTGESYYDGEWVEGSQQGRGTRKYRSGNVYDGEWLCNERHGQGTMHWYDCGERYIGEWVRGVQNGQGEHVWFLRNSDSAQYPLCNRYVGEWCNGLREGKGTFYYASGAVYSGEWRANKKHGRGKFTLQNGQVFEGRFEEDRKVGGTLSSGMEEEALGRPATPLSSLIGDVDKAELSGSVTKKFNLHVSSLIPPTADTELELKQVHCVILRHITELKKIYHCYSSLGRGDQGRQPMERMQLWRLLKDCELHHCGLTLYAADTAISPSPSPPHSPTEPFLMREFLQSLVFVSHTIYWNSGEPDSPAANGKLAWCLSAFIKTCLLPHACDVQGPLYPSPDRHAVAELYQQNCWSMYQCLAKQQPGGEGCVKMRQILLLLKACGVLGEHLTSGEVVSILVRDNPLAVDDGDYNMEVQVTFLEFFEALLQCAEQWFSNRIQTQLENPATITATREAPPQMSSSQGPTSHTASPDLKQTGDEESVEPPAVQGSQEEDKERIEVASPSLLLAKEDQAGEAGRWRDALRLFFTEHLFPMPGLSSVSD